ncbi:TIGR01777 family oxidoreductase [Pseudomonas turukhanskensis]|uniref:NAD-dependent dehydratase n=1 Tax=Pseudomonas turukhanskensis TaxID=1806536 RepID=A0A9W6K4B0_9PSED|nr:TIGR01777 family oxidoreductase [Pseudomonas turukhanskensis]GLK88008.1 hypothetical protein GCM10017655_10700 [Pseudomonas turukhanskensis]
MQQVDSSTLRVWLVRWLYAVAFLHLLGGFVFSWWGNWPIFESYHRSIELAFWGQDVPTAARGMQVWWLALFGVTVQSYAVFMGVLVYLGNRHQSRAAWGGLIAGIVLWAPQDIWISLQLGIRAHAWVDSIAVIALLVPLAWLYRHDGRPAVRAASKPNPFAGIPYLRVLITGGTGFIGETLVNDLLDAGHNVCVFARDPLRAATLFNGRARCIATLAALNEFDTFDAVINLAGAPVAGPRWTPARQKQLLASREGVSQTLVAWLNTARHKPQVWIQASAIGYYGVRNPQELLSEDSAQGRGFMAELCSRWEAANQPVTDAGVRQVVMRLGVVFGPGGALRPLLLPHRFGMGGRVGSGSQVLSWIHRDDVLQVIARALHDTSMRGVYNLVAPDAISQSEFATTAGKVLNRPVWLHVPSAPIRLLAGEMAELFVDGQNVKPTRLIEAGYVFRFPQLEDALRDLA